MPPGDAYMIALDSYQYIHVDQSIEEALSAQNEGPEGGFVYCKTCSALLAKAMPYCVLITGGSGYLGQFLIKELEKEGHRIGYTYLSHDIKPGTFKNARGFRVDLSTGDGLDAVFQALGDVHVVINCAALSQPAVCEQDYQYARSVNVPDALISALVRQKRTRHVDALLVHVSTDQVYDGSHADWTEADRASPINAYGRTKLEAEQYVRTHWEHRIILRTSLIYGPEPPAPVARPLFLQFVERALREGRPTKFLEDEFRSAVYVRDICRCVSALIKLMPDAPPHHTYNLGGPERLSRVDIARAVARHCGHGTKAIERIASAHMDDRGYNSPLDISMHVDRILTEVPGLGYVTPLADALKDIFPAGGGNGDGANGVNGGANGVAAVAAATNGA